MENPIEMDDLGGKPTIFGNIHIIDIITVDGRHPPVEVGTLSHYRVLYISGGARIFSNSIYCTNGQ